MAIRWTRFVGLASWLVITTGCLIKDQTVTWYLDTNGAVTWTVLEKDVHSDAQSAADRGTEEMSYILAAGTQSHPVARGLAELQPLDLKTRILRGTQPFAVATEARFIRLDVLGRQLIWHLGLAGDSTLSEGPDGTTWMFAVHDPHAPNGSAEPDPDLSALADGLDGLKVMLTNGQFVSAAGFQLSADRRAAILIKRDDDVFEHDGIYALKLTWK